MGHWIKKYPSESLSFGKNYSNTVPDTVPGMECIPLMFIQLRWIIQYPLANSNSLGQPGMGLGLLLKPRLFRYPGYSL